LEDSQGKDEPDWARRAARLSILSLPTSTYDPALC
jgi:hypothetical protein